MSGPLFATPYDQEKCRKVNLPNAKSGQIIPLDNALLGVEASRRAIVRLATVGLELTSGRTANSVTTLGDQVHGPCTASVDLRDKGRKSIIRHKVELRIEELERRYLLFASPADPPNIIPSATLLTAVQTLGQNALPATDVIGTASLSTTQSPGRVRKARCRPCRNRWVVCRCGPKRWASGLGSLNPFSRASHGLIEPLPPQQVQPPNPEDANAAYHLEDAIDSVARATSAISLTPAMPRSWRWRTNDRCIDRCGLRTSSLRCTQGRFIGGTEHGHRAGVEFILRHQSRSDFASILRRIEHQFPG